MKQHWFPLALIALAMLMAAGCETPQPEVEKPEVNIADLAADPDLLPTPRPALDTAPDLSGGVLVVNEATLAKMSADAVPASVVDALRSLQGREFTNANEFAEAVRGAAGADADGQMDRILRNALVISLADEPAAPQGEVSIAQREQAQMQAMADTTDYGIVYFDFDKSEIKPEFEATIKQNAEALLANDVNVTIEGHCDERGTNEYNLALGQRRAEAIRRALIAAGVPASRISTRSYGEERPVALGHDEASWSQNRRGVLVTN